ncbi:MAG TPA: bifunctional YncE family protein/alkaline phosphatase family protein [Bacteroidota bacterium]|nr:bifunctional YncE family protein/alkaline phosphatase family protein [Bacteroidota bacterium]
MKNFAFMALAAVIFAACSQTPTLSDRQLPGKMNDGRTLLPNGWILSPAGTSVDLGDLPLGMHLSADGKFAAVVNSGEGKQTISLVDVTGRRVIQTLPIKKSWLGIRFNSRGNRIYVSAGNDNGVNEYAFEHDSVSFLRTIELGKPYSQQDISPADIALADGDSLLLVAAKGNNSLYKIALPSGTITGVLQLSHPLYSCAVDEGRHLVYASVWGGAQVAVVDLDSMLLRKLISVGDHPNEMVLTKDGKRLFVANANVNSVSVIGLDGMKVIETISTSLSPDALGGSTPNSLELSPDNSTLYVANADNNFLAVIDVEKFGASRSLGFIPTGWYPTAVRCAGNLLLVANGKGMISKANPHHEYIASLLVGSLSFIPLPSKEELASYTAQVVQNTPLTRTRPAPQWDDQNPIPKSTSSISPIKHVFYVIKENRTYDQVFGDIPQGNGDSALCLFGKDVTPNHHALAEEFALLDNYYEDAEVSADGHNWSMAAYATDFVEKTWPTFYGGRGGEYVYEGEGITSPTNGYIWDDCVRHNVSMRNYGEFVDEEDTTKGANRVKASALIGRTSPDYRGWDLNYPDVQRVDAWLQEFDAYEAGDSLPQFEIIKLPNDHTAGSRRGSLTPRAMVADNDKALGTIVERISHSKYWKESAVFVLEDDAQNGPDHVDAHRSIALVVSPYTRHHVVDHTMYSTSGMLRTMELILGLPPMSQYDASATPMFASFTPQPDLTPFMARNNIIDLQEKNALGAFGQERMEAFNLSREDLVPDNEFNEIIWKSVKGASSDMPAPVRSAFMINQESHDDDDD